MIELIKISQAKIGDEEQYVVSARDLYEKLGIKKDFSDWIKIQIQRGFFEENIDFVTVPLKGESEKVTLYSNGLYRNEVRSHSVDYILTLDTAKDLAMIPESRKGQEVRKYFIQVEKEYQAIIDIVRNQIPEPLTEKANCWGSIRLDGKKGRLTFTDSIQLFIKYAKSQGSQHSENYYHLFTDNIYLKLGFLSSKKDLIQLKKMKKETGFNFRNILSTSELSLISIAEINNCTNYK